jgi:hypothetical protein
VIIAELFFILAVAFTSSAINFGTQILIVEVLTALSLGLCVVLVPAILILGAISYSAKIILLLVMSSIAPE